MTSRKLTEKQIKDILNLYDTDIVSVLMISRLFGISRTHVYRIIKSRGVKKRGNCKLTDDEVNEIRDHYEMYTDSMRTIARMYGVSHAQVCNIINHKQRGSACKD